MGLAHDYIRPKHATFQGIPSHIHNNSHYMPYFKVTDCDIIFTYVSIL
jgi:hypothetical protein